MEDDLDILAGRLRDALAADPRHPRAGEMAAALAEMAEADALGEAVAGPGGNESPARPVYRMGQWGTKNA
ncbi:MAG: hypothetical protein IH626_05490 [Rhodospirillales bacterium]|nr:hypothetical protein [Rhodospirillales bacterium]